MGLLGNLFGQKKNDGGHAGAGAYAWMGTDIHDHLLPGIDDGSADIDTSLAFLRRYHELGIQQVVATPHIRHPYFPNDKETIRAAFERLEHEPARKMIPVKIAYSAEYYMDDVFLEMLERDELMPFGNNYVLTELSLSSKSFLDMDQVASRMFAKGLRPILAHPERYLYWGQSMDVFSRLKSKGWLLQLNLMSLAGYYGKAEYKTAHFLLDNDMVDLVGTDAHRMKHFDVLGSMDRRILEKLSNKYLLNKFISI